MDKMPQELSAYFLRMSTTAISETLLSKTATSEYRYDISAGLVLRTSRSAAEHIWRLINVKKGILFTNNSTGDDEAFTVIDDVGIELRNDSNAVGIQIGDLTLSSTLLKPYASFIKATVWMKSAGGTGMLVNGELKCSLVNLRAFKTLTTLATATH